MKDFRSWLIFSMLCLLSLQFAFWLREGTDTRVLTSLQSIATAIQKMLAHKSPGQPVDLHSTLGGATPIHREPTSPQTVGANTRLGHTAHDQRVCARPPTKPRTDTGANIVYQWLDEKGQTHLSDTAPQNHVAAVMDMAGNKRDFTYTIEADGVSLPLSFEGQIAAGSKRIYDTWHFFLGEEKLRQSHITLRLIGGPARFDWFRLNAWPNGQPVDGFYSPDKNEAYVKYDSRVPKRAIAVSFHEISHLITASHLGPTPPWLTEGLAEYFETMKVSHQGSTIFPNRAHIRLLQQSAIPRLQDFLALNRDGWNGDLRELNYAVAWSLMQYLMQGAPGIFAIKEVVEQGQAHFCKPFSWSTALHNAYPGGLIKLESDWRTWLAQGRFSLQQT